MSDATYQPKVYRKDGGDTLVIASSGKLEIESGASVTYDGNELADELGNVIDGITASAAEINKLDGVTAGTAAASKAVVLGTDKNLDVIAVADLKLGAGAGTSVTSSAAELNVLDGVSAGTASASKAAVLGADKNLDVLAVADLKLGAGAGTSVTSTAAELNKLDGAGAIVASGTQAVKINDPSGGATQDAEARTAINAIIDALEAFGISAAA